MSEVRPKKVLLVCTHNSVRSQMAEAFMRSMAADRFIVHSAGTEPTGVDPTVVRVMGEVDIDISGWMSKSIVEFVGQRFDCVLTLCDSARQSCPDFPGAADRLHWDLPDPGSAAGTPEEQLELFRGIRDRIRELVTDFLSTH